MFEQDRTDDMDGSEGGIRAESSYASRMLSCLVAKLCTLGND